MSAILALMAGMLSQALPVRVAEASVAGPAGDPSAPVLVVMTYAQLHWSGRAAFIQSSIRIAGKLPAVPGVLANDQGIRWFGAEVWTITAWRSEAHMLAFLHGGEHGRAMREGAVAIREIKTFRLHCSPQHIPAGWDSVKQVLAGQMPKSCERVRA
jgi:hypothetical protein